jgi:hypothetical protein
MKHECHFVDRILTFRDNEAFSWQDVKSHKAESASFNSVPRLKLTCPSSPHLEPMPRNSRMNGVLLVLICNDLEDKLGDVNVAATHL